jgi:type IV pilus assembly protein PilV
MRRNRRFESKRAGTERGFSMLEILITLFLLTMWLLASAGVQTSSLQYTKAASFRTQAIYLATELAERMQANKTVAVGGSYAFSSSSPVSSSTDCTASLCTSADLAAFDLSEWSTRVSAALPNATMTVTANNAGTNPMTYTIFVSWTDRRTDRTYSASGSSETFSYTSTVTVFDDPLANS